MLVRGQFKRNVTVAVGNAACESCAQAEAKLGRTVNSTTHQKLLLALQVLVCRLP